MKLKLYEEFCFIVLILFFSYSTSMLIHYSLNNSFLSKNTLYEGMEDGDVDPNLDINNADYTQQMKSVGNYGFSKEGSWSTLNSNVKGMKKILEGIIYDQTKLTKKGNPIGVKYAVDTGFECSDPEGNVHKQYTYIDNLGDSDLGLAFEIGNTIGNYGDSLNGLKDAMSSSEDTVCKEVEIRAIDNLGNNKTQTVHLDSIEIDKINSDNIIQTKTYVVPEETEETEETETEETETEETETEEQEGFKTLENNSFDSYLKMPLLYDDLFYKDTGIFLYFTLLNILFLYFIFIILINN